MLVLCAGINAVGSPTSSLPHPPQAQGSNNYLKAEHQMLRN
jgi:hypothetical protein